MLVYSDAIWSTIIRGRVEAVIATWRVVNRERHAIIIDSDTDTAQLADSRHSNLFFFFVFSSMPLVTEVPKLNIIIIPYL